MRNGYLSEGTRRDINWQVAKVLKGLGDPKPPLVIEDVVELLKLDRQFYSSTNDSVLREKISRIKVGALQVFKRPALILDVVLKADLRAFYLPDRKRILIDEERVKPLKIRWTTAHEITHHLCLDWHGDVLFGDNESTLNLGCHEQIEREANYGAGQLPTLQQDLTEQLVGDAYCFSTIRMLAEKVYKNTIVSTLWRSVEQSKHPVFAVIGKHPHHNPGEACKYFVRSEAFVKEFSQTQEVAALMEIRRYCKWTKVGKLGECDIALTNDRGELESFRFETFATKYDTMTLARSLKAQ